MATAAGSALRPERTRFENGLVLLHNRAAANPSVVVRALIRAGSSRETPREHGIAGLSGRMLRQGTQNIPKGALAEELDGMGAGLSVDVGYALVSVSIKCLNGDFARAMEILAELVRRPLLPADELERLKGQILTDLKEMDDNTRVVSERAWRELAYPPAHAYHRLSVGDAASVQAATRDHLANFVNAWYGGNQTTLMVVGDVSLDDATAAAERNLGDWPTARTERVQTTLPATELAPGQLREVAMVGKTQGDVSIGLPTLERTSPDYYALSFANHVLGRMYFMGRFGEKVRDEQGLAYYAYSELQGSYGRGGWLMRAGVNPRNLDKALSSIDAELKAFLADGPTPAEQADGVSSLLGSLPRQLETNEGAAAVMGEIELYDLGLDYLERYPEIVRSLTREQVTEAARRWILPEHLITAIAGPPRVVHVPDPRAPSEAVVEALNVAFGPDYRIVSIEPRAGQPYQVQAADLLATLKQFGFPPVVMVSERFGCVAALLLAAWHPGHVQRLLLVDPIYAAPNADDRSVEARALRDCPPDWRSLRAAVHCPVLEADWHDAPDGQTVRTFLRLP
ncbi:MAG: insulinase family protein [Chloroflexi bacterium]|nr:insulinase family protein [Chloroflexota bacterium]